MSELTKEQRNKVYQLALTNYKNLLPEIKLGYRSAGLCYYVKEAHCDFLQIKDKCNVEKYTIVRGYAEFMSQRPEALTVLDYWWSLRDTDSRIACLEQCIKETE